MTVTELGLPGVLLLQLDVYRDERGYFQEVWNPARVTVPGVHKEFVQDNIAFSHHRVLRGLHFQRPHEQAKLIVALTGTIFDVAVDVRAGSPTFGQWVGTELAAGTGHMLYIPEGFAHGYQVLSATAQVLYKCTDIYHPEAEHSLAWNDPAIGIHWPLPDPVLSEKDRTAPTLADLQIGKPAAASAE
jgi:dTDP-4-dehydrorhamnose 3,5-epimerase